jgi:hypothetical protein
VASCQLQTTLRCTRFRLVAIWTILIGGRDNASRQIISIRPRRRVVDRSSLTRTAEHAKQALSDGFYSHGEVGAGTGRLPFVYHRPSPLKINTTHRERLHIMSSFWDGYYPDFTRNLNAPIHAEFARLAAHKGWTIGSKRYRKAYSRCMREEFTRHYGSDEEYLEGWRMLCSDVGIRDVPNTITQCKKASLSRR